MAKLAFLLALVIALVAVSSAWTMTAPVTGNIVPGSLMNFSFKAEAATTAPTSIVVNFDAAFFDATAVAAEGQTPSLCTVGDKVVGTSSFPATTLTISITEAIALNDVVTCQYRVVTNPTAAKYTVTYTAPVQGLVVAADASAVLTVTKAAPTVDITTASSKNGGSTDVTIKFGALTASTLYGPLTLGYKYASSPDTPTDAYVQNWMITSDFTAPFDAKVRLVIVGGNTWLLTDAAAPAEASVTLQFGTWVTFNKDDATKDYSVWATLDVYDAKVTGTKVVGQMPALQNSATAQIAYTKGKVYYSMTISKNTSVDPTFKFSISKYSADVVFGTGATLAYTVGGTAGPVLDLSGKAFEYKLTAAVDKVIQVTGSFTAATYELASIDASIDGQSDNAQIVVTARPDKIVIGAVTENVLSYTYTVVSDATDFAGSIDYDFTSSMTYVNVGDIRAFDAYSPECKSDMGKVSVDGKVTKDEFDAKLIPVMTSGSLEKGSTTHTITCTQKLHAGAKAKSLTVALSTVGTNSISVVKDMSWTLPETIKYNQKVIIKGAAITSQADMDALISKVTDMFVAEWTGEGSMVKADYVYSYVDSTTQHYAANVAGLALQFGNPMVQHWSKAGSLITLAFTRKATVDTAFNKVFQGADLWVMISGDDNTADNGTPAPTTVGLKAPATFVDGSVLAGYELNTSIGNGFGFKCATSAQCSSSVCLKGMCSEFGQLTRDQQAAATQGGSGDSSSASAVFTTLALVIAVVALLF